MDLSSHLVLSSKDIDELRAELGQRFTPHQLNIAKRNHEIDARVCSCAVNRLGLLSFSYGEGVPIDAVVNRDQCSEVVSLNFLASGAGRLKQHRESSEITADQGLVIDMESPFKLELQGYGGVALICGHDALRRHARSLIGEEAGDVDLRLEKTVDLTKPAGRALKNAVVHAVNEMNGDLGLANNPVSLTNLENYLLTQFIALHPGSFRNLIESGFAPKVMPRNLKRARDYIHAHAREKITLDALATHAGCSYRSLQGIFGKVLNVSPMAYLRSVRLEGVRDELLNADSRHASVAEIANRWGFIHMGRFALFYKKQFGVLPSDTLSRKK